MWARTATETAYGIKTHGTESNSWYVSVYSKYYTEGHTWTGSRVPIFTSIYNQTAITNTMTGIGYLETGILQAEGYDVVSSVVTVTECETSPTATGTCTPHDDHCLWDP